MRLQTGVLFTFILLHTATTANGDGHGGGHSNPMPTHTKEDTHSMPTSKKPWEGLINCFTAEIQRQMMSGGTGGNPPSDGGKTLSNGMIHSDRHPPSDGMGPPDNSAGARDHPSEEHLSQMEDLAPEIIKQCLANVTNDGCRNANDTEIKMMVKKMMPQKNRLMSCPPREKVAKVMMDRACGVYHPEKPWNKITGCVLRHVDVMDASKREMAERSGNMTKCPGLESSESNSPMTDKETLKQCLEANRDGGCRPNDITISKMLDHYFSEKDECNKEPRDDEARWMLDDACGDAKPWGRMSMCLWGNLKAEMMEKMENSEELDEDKTEDSDEMKDDEEKTMQSGTLKEHERHKCEPSESKSKPMWTVEEKTAAKSKASSILKLCLVSERPGICKQPNDTEISNIVTISFQQMEDSTSDPSVEDANNMMDKACGTRLWEKMTQCLRGKIMAKMDTEQNNEPDTSGSGAMTRGEGELMKSGLRLDMGDHGGESWSDKEKNFARQKGSDILTILKECLSSERSDGCRKPNNTEIARIKDAALATNLTDTDNVRPDEETKRWMDKACDATALGLEGEDRATNLHISETLFLVILAVTILHF